MRNVGSALSFLFLFFGSLAAAESPLRGGDQGERHLAWCGGHKANSCSECPWNGNQWMAHRWCNGDCDWLDGECVHKDDTAWCGGHAAKDCGHCPWNGDTWMAANWCNGDCVWMDETCVHKDEAPTNGFHEKLGQCSGAVCSMWGDPHIITCDGLAYDCQGTGLFTLMKNHLYNIQGHFIPVGAKEMEMAHGWGLRDGASITNDVIIDYLPDNDGAVPTMQFSFADLSKHDGTFASEEGCEPSKYYQPLDMPGQGRSVEPTLVDCRNRCHNTKGCDKFSYWADGGCHITHEAAILNTPHGWSRNVAGDLSSTCGKEVPKLDAHGLPIQEDFEKSKTIGNGNDEHQHGPGCPILFYLDGELQDISGLRDDAFLYGDEKSDHSAQLVGYNEIHVIHKTESGATSEAMLKVDGNGPGELWSCHWNFWVCLPEEEQRAFEEATVGLFGSPDGNAQNDWMDEAGKALPIPHGKKNGRESFDYCRDNWCVSQEDSLMAYPTGETYEGHRCGDEEYVDFNVDQEHCVLSATKIKDHCRDMPPLLLHSCQVDCCYGGCNSIGKVAATVVELQTYVADTEEDKIVYNPPETPVLCDGDYKASTGDTVCPNSSKGIVKVLHGSDKLPDYNDIIYGIALEDYYQDDNVGRTVKFRIASPFEKDADVYVRYEKKVGNFANDPACDTIENVSCDESDEIEVGCVEFPDVEPFAIFDLYFVSKEDSFILNNAGDAEVEKCCKAPAEKYADGGYKIIKYSFEIKCTCPGADVGAV